MENILEIVLKWVKMAEYDLEAAKSLYKSKDYLMCVFHLQQSVEKYLKAYFIFTKKEQPLYIHNLIRLAEACDLKIEDKDLFDELNPFYIEARYPTYKTSLAQSLNNKTAKDLLNRTEELIKWLNQKLN